MASDAISGLDHCSVLSTRTHSKFGAFCLEDEDSFRSVVVKGTLFIEVCLGRSKLHPARMICIQDSGQALCGISIPNITPHSTTSLNLAGNAVEGITACP
eukprot:8092828-Pyramimonas_sp.AAC.2